MMLENQGMPTELSASAVSGGGGKMPRGKGKSG